MPAYDPEVHVRHPTWAYCTVCGEWFTSDAGFDRHMTSDTSRTCKHPSTVTSGNSRMIYDEVYGAWRWQSGDTPPYRKPGPPRGQGRSKKPEGGVEVPNETPSHFPASGGRVSSCPE
jgi:hypothetical protein